MLGVDDEHVGLSRVKLTYLRDMMVLFKNVVEEADK